MVLAFVLASVRIADLRSCSAGLARGFRACLFLIMRLGTVIICKRAGDFCWAMGEELPGGAPLVSLRVLGAVLMDAGREWFKVAQPFLGGWG